MSIIRENITVTPVTTERIDTVGAIHRYIFGWTVQHTITSFDSTMPDGIIVDSSSVLVQGYDRQMNEVTGISILPPSLEVPDVSANTGISGVKVVSFVKEGEKARVYTRIRVSGDNELIEYGLSPYSVYETKSYADAMGDGQSDGGGAEGEGAEGGIIVTAANGVLTETKMKG